MWRTLEINKDDWSTTPASVGTTLISLYLENHSVRLRTFAYQNKISTLSGPSAHIKKLNEQIAEQKKQIAILQKQLVQTTSLSAEIIKLKAEVADLKENSVKTHRIRNYLHHATHSIVNSRSKKTSRPAKNKVLKPVIAEKAVVYYLNQKLMRLLKYGPKDAHAVAATIFTMLIGCPLADKSQK